MAGGLDSRLGQEIALSAGPLVLLWVILVLAVVFDVREHRIPNWLSLPGWLLGLAIGAVVAGWGGLAQAGLGLLFMLAVWVPFFVLGWFGAGDVKLMGTVGAFVGFEQAPVALLGITLSGAVLALLVLAWNRQLGAMLRRLGAMVGLTFIDRRLTYIDPPPEQRLLILPYAVPIAVGTFLVTILPELGLY